MFRSHASIYFSAMHAETIQNTFGILDKVVAVQSDMKHFQQRMLEPGTIARINIPHIISDPTAAAIAYGLDKKVVHERCWIVLIMGYVEWSTNDRHIYNNYIISIIFLDFFNNVDKRVGAVYHYR